MISAKVLTSGFRSTVFGWMKKKSDICFLAKLLQPILDIQQNGFVFFQIGRGENARTIKFVPYLYCFSLDTAEARTITGTTMGPKKCRMCERNCGDFSMHLPPIVRDATQLKLCQQLGETVWKKNMTQGTRALNVREKQVCITC